jgi:hypothetical protein
MIICDETASECLPCERLAVEMCWFESADFQMSPSDIEIKVKILLANLKF